MENTGKIFGISAGTGRSGMITLKALKALKPWMLFFVPGGRNPAKGG